MTSDYLDEFGHYDDWSGKEEDYKKGAVWTYAGEIDEDLMIPLGDGDISRVFKKDNTYISIKCNGIKPILRPLSDLTKDIEYRGEKFVPLKKLHELDETNYFGNTEEKGYKLRFMDKVISVKHNTYKLSGTEEFVVKYLVETSNIGDLIYSFSYDPELRRFLKRDDTRSIPLGIGYQLDMFNKLFEWNFDVFGLIDKGLAIDINTL